MACLDRVLADLGLPLQLTKCRWHIPGLRGVDQTEWPPTAIRLLDVLAVSLDGITLLGTEACRELATPLHVPAQTPAGAKQAAFALARCLISHALDYDASVLPCSLVLPHARILDQKVLGIIALTMDAPTPDSLPADALAQLALPQRLWGMQVDLPSHTAPLARAACLMERGPALRLRIAE